MSHDVKRESLSAVDTVKSRRRFLTDAALLSATSSAD
jgi:hypothetical protein